MCRGPGLRCLPERVGLNEVLGLTLIRVREVDGWCSDRDVHEWNRPRIPEPVQVTVFESDYLALLECSCAQILK